MHQTDGMIRLTLHIVKQKRNLPSHILQNLCQKSEVSGGKPGNAGNDPKEADAEENAEAADRDDMYSSFMNLLSLQDMFHEIAQGIEVDDFEIMDKFDPHNLEMNVCVFNTALSNYLAEYEKVGIRPKHYGSVEEFEKDYCKAIHNN